MAAAEGEVRFDHAAQHLRDTRDLRAALAQVRAELEVTGVTVVEQARWWQELGNLRDGAGELLTEDAHRDCPGHAATVHQQWTRDADADDGYRVAARISWVCTDPQAHGHQGHYPGSPAPVGSPPEGGSEPAADADAAVERARAERRRVIVNNRAWRSAETVRRQC